MTSPSSADRELPDDGFLEFVSLATRRTRQEFGDADEGLALPISLLLRRVSRRMATETERELLVPEGLNWASFRVCFTLWAAGPLEPHRVAVMSSMSRAAVSAARKALQGRGFVETTGSASDMRSIVLSLTPSGAAFTAEVHRRNLELSADHLRNLSSAEQHILFGLLAKVLASTD